MGLLFMGDAKGAVAPLKRGLELSPNDPQKFIWFNVLPLALVLSADAEGAIEAAQKVHKIRPEWRPGFDPRLLPGHDGKLGRGEPVSAAHADPAEVIPAMPWWGCSGQTTRLGLVK